MRKPRHISADEKALWDVVASRTEPLKKLRAPLVQQAAPSRQVSRSEGTGQRFEDFVVGSSVNHHADHDLIPSLNQQLRNAPVRMDQKAYGKLRRGKMKPDARLDLHGMTLAQANPVLTGFILRSAGAGHRLVLVITGKGKDRDDGGPIPTKFGVLRHQVPQWLSMPPLGGLVLQVTTAHIRHGGGGAYYVYLCRAR